MKKLTLSIVITFLSVTAHANNFNIKFCNDNVGMFVNMTRTNDSVKLIYTADGESESGDYIIKKEAIFESAEDLSLLSSNSSQSVIRAFGFLLENKSDSEEQVASIIGLTKDGDYLYFEGRLADFMGSVNRCE